MRVLIKLTFLVKNTQGVGLIVVMGLISTLFIFGSAMSTLVLQRVQLQQDFLRQLAELEMLESSFAALEVALERRRWEPPSDDGCLAREEFGAEITMSDGRVIEVTATYNPTTRQYWLRASVPSVAGGTVVATKAINTIDISDFLLLNMGSSEVRLERPIFGRNIPLGLIARDRRIQHGGAINFVSRIGKPAGSWSTNLTDPKPMALPEDAGFVIQAERIVAVGGLEYLRHTNYAWPNLTHYAFDSINPLKAGGFFLQQSVTPVIITRDTGFARSIFDSAASGEMAGLPPREEIRQASYPIALFCDPNRPMDANSASDTGCYHGDPDDWRIFNYTSPSGTGDNTNATCAGLGAARCSHSEAFPNGFNQWRSDASLQGVLYTSDGETVGRRPLDWDNFDSYREDAEKCGVVVTSLSGSDGFVEDCDISDRNLVNSYRLNPGTNPCSDLHILDMENLAGKFSVPLNPADLTDPDNINLILPRVVYSEVPLELRQTHMRGLMVDDVGGAVARANFALNIVSQEKVVLRPKQTDLTSPLDDPPGGVYMREVYFNSDGTDPDPDTQLTPIKLAIVSPESLQMITPQHVPIDFAGLQDMWPVVGARVRPRLHLPTDWQRQEDDGFRYGLRRVIIQNMAQITPFNAGTGADHPPIYLRGLWQYRNSSVRSFPSFACMFAEPGDTDGVPGYYQWVSPKQPIPARADDPGSVIPPSTSRYYDPDGFVPVMYVPHVFEVQRLAGLGFIPEVHYSGVILRPRFSDQDIPGRRRLDQQSYRHMSPLQFPLSWVDLSERFASWAHTSLYQQTLDGDGNLEARSCAPGGGILSLSGSPANILMMGHNLGENVQSTFSPRDDFRRVGTLYHTDMPLISGE